MKLSRRKSIAFYLYEIHREMAKIFIKSSFENNPYLEAEEFNDIKWITADEIPDYEFCLAYKDILEKIMEERYENI